MWAYGILVPWLGIESWPSAVKAPSSNHWTAQKFPELPISSWFNFGGLYVLYISRNLHISSECQICWRIIVHSILLGVFVFCGISWDFSFYISNFSKIWVLSFFLVSLAKDLSVLFALSKNQLLVLLIFFSIVFLNLYFISSLINLYFISFILLTLGFVCSFSNYFRW